MLETSFGSFFNQASKQIVLKEETSEQGVLLHLTHLEELILTAKKRGLDIAIQFLKELYRTLKGSSKSKTFVSVKFDGAPSIIAGYNPQDKKFFVSTKSLGNVTPKINYTPEDVDRNHGHAPGLAEKLKQGLMYLPLVIRTGIYQGDFMFDQKDVKRQNIDGQDLLLFKPNTITYAIDQHSPLGQRILSAKIGVIFHTKYSGISLQNLKKSSDVNVSEFNQTNDVFVDDAKFKDISGIATFTQQESNKLDSTIDSCVSAGNQIKWDEISDKTYEYLNTFINSLVRQSRFIEDPQKEYESFIEWIKGKGTAAINAMKTPKGKERKQQSLNELISTLESNQTNILNLLNLTKKLEEAKRMFIDKYNSAIKTKQFLTQPDGTLKVTAPEGYVAVDHLGNMVKFVDRLSFSAANFVATKAEKFK